MKEFLDEEDRGRDAAETNENLQYHPERMSAAQFFRKVGDVLHNIKRGRDAAERRLLARACYDRVEKLLEIGCRLQREAKAGTLQDNVVYRQEAADKSFVVLSDTPTEIYSAVLLLRRLEDCALAGAGDPDDEDWDDGIDRTRGESAYTRSEARRLTAAMIERARKTDAKTLTRYQAQEGQDHEHE